MTGAFNKSLYRNRERYRHFESIEGVFYNLCKNYTVTSTSGFAIDTARLDEDFRITRFVRDPRDLIVSGYHYHLRGAEPWFRMANPTNKYWEPINGNVPAGLSASQSYADYLSGLNQEDGLMAEIEFRKFHLDSFRHWPKDERIKLFKYEDILGNEKAVFSAIADHYELSRSEKARVLKNAEKFSLGKVKNRGHIRNPKPKQWKDHFTPKVSAYFNEHYADLLEMYNYEESSI